MARYLLAAAVVGVLASGIYAGEAPGKEAEKPPATSKDDAVPRKLTMDLIVNYLNRWEIKHLEMDMENKLVIFTVQYDDTPFRFMLSIAGDDGDILIVSIRNLAHIKKEKPGFLPALEIMARENYNIMVGCWGYDPADGEVTLDQTFLAAGGLSYKDFSRGLDGLLSAADDGKKQLDAALGAVQPKMEKVPAEDTPAAEEK